jgi:membrane-bound inhibitor of C-type lysozyme
MNRATNLVMTLAAAAMVAACQSGPTPEQIEAANNTFVCQARGERIVIRFDTGEARMLLPNGERITLYQVASPSGARYMNGLIELRGQGTQLTLIHNGAPTALESCHNPTLPQS